MWFRVESDSIRYDDDEITPPTFAIWDTERKIWKIEINSLEDLLELVMEHSIKITLTEETWDTPTEGLDLDNMIINILIFDRE